MALAVLTSLKVLRWPRLGRLIAQGAMWGVLCAVIVVGSWMGWALQGMPDTSRLWTAAPPDSIRVYDRSGQLIAVRGVRYGAPVDLDDLPDYVYEAVIAIEDRRFRSHPGVDPKGIMRAALANRRAGRVVQGGSTLTQQLAKNLFLSPERSFRRKSQELLLALWLERRFSKDEILALYLNRVYFGAGTWGLEAASEYYYGKAAKDLSVGEAALLAGLLKAPSRDNPVNDAARAEGRTTEVLRVMRDTGKITETQYKTAMAEPININLSDQGGRGWFVDYAIAEARSSGVPLEGNIRIYTTLDLKAQRLAEISLKSHLDPERGASEGAVLSLAADGQILAMVGGADYRASQYNRAVQAKRQPGSSFKPFVYLTALEKGFTPETLVTDAPIQIGDWSPGNYDGKFYGEITLAEGFRRSLNTIAVQLSEASGREEVAATAERFGLTGLQPLPSIALGAQDVTLMDLTTAYLPFAARGRPADPFAVQSIYQGTTPVYRRQAPDLAPRVIQTRELGAMTYLFRQTVQSGTGRAALIPGVDMGGKTGTTNDFRDAWFVGFVSDQVTAVWVGNDDYTEMNRVTGGSIPARIWHDMMAPWMEGRPGATLPDYRPKAVSEETVKMDSLLSEIDLLLKTTPGEMADVQP